MRTEIRRARLLLPSIALVGAAIWVVAILTLSYRHARFAADNIAAAVVIHQALDQLQQERDGRVLSWLGATPGFDVARASRATDRAIARLSAPVRDALPDLYRLRLTEGRTAVAIGDTYQGALDNLRGAEITTVAGNVPPATAMAFRARSDLERRLDDMRWRGAAALVPGASTAPGDGDDDGDDLSAAARSDIKAIDRMGVGGPAGAELAVDLPLLAKLRGLANRPRSDMAVWRTWIAGSADLLRKAERANTGFLEALAHKAEVRAGDALAHLIVGTLATLAVVGLAIRALIGIARAMRSAKDALADRDRTFELIVSEIEDPVLLLDGDCSVQYASPSAKRQFGDQTGCALFCRAAPGNLGQQCRVTGFDRQEIVDPLSGRTYEVSCSSFRRDGAEARLVILHDVTLRKLTEAELDRARVAAESSNAAKSQFLASMSHELRTPLNAIIGYSDALMSGAIPLTEDRYRDYAGNIHEAGRLLLVIIDDILDLSKIEAGRMRLLYSDCSVAEIVAAAMRMVRRPADENGITLNIEGDSGLRVAADGPRLTQVVVNLVTNAVKFTPPGGTVTVRSFRDRDKIHIVVHDTGIGIGSENIERIMQPFGQVESAYSRRYGGTGLGLPIARSLVELHGGRMSLDSTPGQGTIVEVVLPVSAPPEAMAPADAFEGESAQRPA